jgi:integrase
MDRHAATRRLRRLAETAGFRIASPHPPMLRHTAVTTMLDAGVDLRDVQIAARHADPRTSQVAPARCRAGAGFPRITAQASPVALRLMRWSSRQCVSSTRHG